MRRARWWRRSWRAKSEAGIGCAFRRCASPIRKSSWRGYPAEAKASGIAIKTAIFPFRANGRAMTFDSDAGFIRVVARADNHLLLGIQGVGAGIAELSASFGLALEMGARLEDIAQTVHAHPTQGEGFMEAAHKALGYPIHL